MCSLREMLTQVLAQESFESKVWTCHVYNGVSIIRIITPGHKIRTSTERIEGLALINDDG
jgi:hypothetical protein